MTYMALGLLVLRYRSFIHQWNVTAFNTMHFVQASRISTSANLLRSAATNIKIVNYLEIVYAIVMFFTKLFIALQLLNVFASTHKNSTY